MKTISQIVKMLDAGLIKPEEIYEIEARDIARMFKAHQRALDKLLALEAKIASFEIVERREKVVYG